MGTRFGFLDAGRLSSLAKGALTNLYLKHYPTSVHKIPKDQLDKVSEALEQAYIDDYVQGITANDLTQELKSPTFIHCKGFEIKHYYEVNV